MGISGALVFRATDGKWTSGALRRAGQFHAPEGAQWLPAAIIASFRVGRSGLARDARLTWAGALR